MNPLPTRPLDDPALLSLHTQEDLAEYLRTRRLELNQLAGGENGGLALTLALSDLVDGVMRRILHLACVRADRVDRREPVPVAIVATGGYGRRELCPYSDIDITFIPHRENDTTVDHIIKEMFTLLMRVFMDANGLSVGYAYRLLPDCAGLDHHTTSGLLDARLIAGSDRLFIQLEDAFWAGFNPAAFLFTKQEEMRARQAKFGVTPRVVEPHLKEGAGGLRDLQTAVWITQALHSLSAARVRGERIWDCLVREANLPKPEIKRLKAAKEFLFRVRNALHVITGAERDQLVVTRQEQVAERMGYPLPPLPGTRVHADTPPVELFMRDYYRHASTLHLFLQSTTKNAQTHRLFLGIGIDCLGSQIVPANSALDCEDPLWMLWACELAQKFGLEFSEDLERVIVDLLDTEPIIHEPTLAAEIFTNLLASPRGAWPILQRMADLGILGWLLPEVGQTLDLIPYDPSHDYTVGQHTLYVLRNLDSLRTADGSDETREFRQMMQELPHPEELYLAALLHDAGKGMDDRPHSETGEDLARAVCRRFGWNEAATENVAFLVRHHLLMSETSRLRDLNLDETIRDFVSVVDDLDRLHMLYLLTYADTSAVGTGIWTQVKGRFMRELLHKAEHALAAGEQEYDDPGLLRTRRRILKELSVENLPPEEVTEHIESMPATYLLNTGLDEITFHIGAVRRARQGEPTVDFQDERDSTFTEVTVCAPDDPEPGLLAKLTGVFYAADLDVHSAQVFTRVTPARLETTTETGTTGERIAIDKFFVDFRGRQLTPGKRKEVSGNLSAVLTGKTTVDALLAKRRKTQQAGGQVQAISVRNDLSETYTVVQVTSTEDQGMLYRASEALSALRWDIHSARVSLNRGNTIAGFYVTGVRPMGDGEAQRALNRVLVAIASSNSADQANGKGSD